MMITVKDALRIILSEIFLTGIERVPIMASINRVLAEDVVACYSNPPFNNSAMDGYALRASDVKKASDGNPTVLDVVDDIPAGSISIKTIGLRQAARIMTGAPVPKGADAVVMVEYTEAEGTGVKVYRKVSCGENIRMSGEDYGKGQTVIKEGTLVRSSEIAMIAAVGKPNVSVYQRPRVAVLATGDELVDLGQPLAKGKIVNSNSYALSAQLVGCGADPVILGIAGDNRDDLKKSLRNGLHCDCMISSGGVSVGDFDFVKDVLKDMGSEMRFWKVAMKPGKPLAFGVIEGKPAFGLPGNPVSSMIAFEQFIRPAIYKMSGRINIFKNLVTAELLRDIRKKEGRLHFHRGILKYEAGRYNVMPLESQGSGMISSMVKANALIHLPSSVTLFRKGEDVKVEMMDDGFMYRDTVPF